MIVFKGNNDYEMGIFEEHISRLPKTAGTRFLGRGDDGFKIVKASGNAHALQTKNHQRRSRLRKCSFTSFSSCEDFVGNSRTSDEEHAQMTTGAYNEVRDRGVRKGDKVSRDGYFQHEAGNVRLPAFNIEVIT